MGYSLVGLAGYAQVGKNSAAQGLEGWTEVGFADALRELAASINPIVDWNEAHDPVRYNEALAWFGYEEAKRQYPELRGFLQRLGTDAMRTHFGEDVWVDLAFLRVAGQYPVVFTDVRYPNEADAIAERDGLLIRVTRPGYGPVNGHISESALDDYPFPYELDNDGTVEELQAALRALVDGELEAA